MTFLGQRKKEDICIRFARKMRKKQERKTKNLTLGPVTPEASAQKPTGWARRSDVRRSHT